MKRNSWKTVAALVIAALLTTAQNVLACPNCKAGFDKSSEAAALGEAYSASIYMMLLLPILLVGFIALRIARVMREAKVSSPTA